MRFSVALTALASALTVSAANMTVKVGPGSLTFSPSSVTAQAGDMVNFEFQAKNHSVVQSTFDSPCKKMDGGVTSGFQAVPNNTQGGLPTWSIMVKNASKPLWFYCSQALNTPMAHCTAGMVFSINPTADKSQDAFLQKAKVSNQTSAASGSGTPAAAAAAGSTQAADNQPSGALRTTGSAASVLAVAGVIMAFM